MISAVDKHYTYHLLYLTSADEEVDHGTSRIKRITEALEHLNSADGKKRKGPRLARGVSAHSHVVTSFTQISDYLKKVAKPAMLVVDDSISDSDVEFLKTWVTTWQDTDSMYLLRLKNNASTSFSTPFYAEADTDILSSGQRTHLYNELAGGIMYAHNKRHPEENLSQYRD